MENISNAIENIGKVCYYIVHPGEAIAMAWDFTIKFSKVGCLLVFIIAFILAVTTKSDKAKKISISSPVVYLLLQTINSMFKGVF